MIAPPRTLLIKRRTLIGVLLLAGLPAAVPGATSPPRFKPPLSGRPVIHVIYPADSQSIAAVDSTFIIGSVNPGSTLTINNRPVTVYRTGGFLGWLPVQPGGFVFRLKARNKSGSDSALVHVRIADARPIPSDSGAVIRTPSIHPTWNRTIRGGDEIPVSFDGTVGGAARFEILSRRDTLGPYPMIELKGQALTDFQVFRRDEASAPDDFSEPSAAPNGGGRYHGIWNVPEGVRGDSLRVRVSLRGRWKKRESATAFAPGVLIPVDGRPVRVVELTDSVQTLRTGPRLGYFTIFQPYGVRSRWWGEAGPWTILRPAPGYDAWIETEKTRLLPEGTPLPTSAIVRLSTSVEGQWVRLLVGTSERLPFKVTVDDDLRNVHVLIFGATSNTDWVEPDPKDDLIDNVVWSQTVPEVYQIDVRLTQPLWGYDAHYEDRRLVVAFRRAPVVKSGLSGLTIAVDPGHSADPGAIGPTGLMEKDANLRLATNLKAALEKMGARVVMTRTGDEDVPLYERPALALAGRADLFVSVHNNAVPDGINPLAHNGTGTYYYEPFSRALAKAVHRGVLTATGLDDYGLTQGNFAVIRPTQYPATLVECSFIIIPQQEEMLETEKFVTRTAQGIADGIADFVRERLKP
ncbi:MAG: N-acetylmuramoyl-L-alanine amidase [candidate division Zixibacteria bacterium]|nr:N-acetylmuramoyl-L-alanine amidase [candidate division Zixibacteria bacterium]